MLYIDCCIFLTNLIFILSFLTLIIILPRLVKNKDIIKSL